MPRKRGKVSFYCQHKASGQAVVRIDGVDHYLVPYDSPSSQDEYQRLVAEWLARKKDGSGAPSGRPPDAVKLTIVQAIYRYRAFAKTYYVKNGKPTQELTDTFGKLLRTARLYSHGVTANGRFGTSSNVYSERRVFIRPVMGITNTRLPATSTGFMTSAGRLARSTQRP